MFQSAKGFKKEDLVYVAEEIGATLPQKVTIANLKDIILKSKQYTDDPEFVTDILLATISDRKKQEEYEERLKQQEFKVKQQEFEVKQQEFEVKQQEFEVKQQELEEREKIRQHELELLRIQGNRTTVGESRINVISGSKNKFDLPKLEFRQFSGDIKEWLAFWSQFQHIHDDNDIAPENKFQYLIQATVSGSRAREVVDSFPPTGANYAKVIESLKARFGKEDLLVEICVRELLKLVISVHKYGKLSMTSLYDKVESHMRALDSLGVTTDKCASILYPMVESCFNEDFLKAWNRHPSSSSSADAKERLNNLMQFIKTEVEGEERINLAMSGFGLNEPKSGPISKKKQWSNVPTASNLLTTSVKGKKSCIFCMGKHSSADCFSAQKMSFADRQNIIKDKNCCFGCLNPGHTIRKCRMFFKCVVCGKKHVPLMGEAIASKKNESSKVEEIKEVGHDVNMSNGSTLPQVFLQTLKGKLISRSNEVSVRIILDSGSQRSYIQKSLAEKMGYTPIRKEKLVHSLFGGIKSKEVMHSCYRIRLKSFESDFTYNFEALDQTTICNDVMPVSKGSWIKELQSLNIVLHDVGEMQQEVQVLIGNDLYGKFLTGQRRVLSSGLVAMETLLGWTLSGKIPENERSSASTSMLVTSLFVNDLDISKLWKLDSIGIKDPVEKLSRQEQEDLTKENFIKSVKYCKEEERYEVQLPWLKNCVLCVLDTTTKKLCQENLFNKYEKVLMEWLHEGIIEEVPSNEIDLPGNYLPHRPVIKENSTTPIRPVFDASARMKGHPSLNESLHSGPNLIELIPDILLRFREKKFGVVADIRKAFLQIKVCKKDRDFLRFLWWENEDLMQLKTFRHNRVVFGVTSSPFLLGAIIHYHITSSDDLDNDIKEALLKSFYVDNVVTSVECEEDLERFIEKSTEVMHKGGFDLRGWEHSEEKPMVSERLETPLLGLIWNRQQDTLKINLSWFDKVNLESITKRTILSILNKVYDPIGYTTPVLLPPKLILQESWKTGIGWDEEITGSFRTDFVQWFKELEVLKEVTFPRWLNVTSDDIEHCSIHTFCDASKDAYAAVTYLVKEGESENIHLLAARSRVAPLKQATIPRLELLAALVGARLTKSIVDALGWTSVKRFYWSDSTTVLTWITKDENWSIFVRNRVQEIRSISEVSSWHHVSGVENPADLPSRGCKAGFLRKTRWWEGPQWLTLPKEEWPQSMPDEDKNEIDTERRKEVVTALSNMKDMPSNNMFNYFSKYTKTLRMMAWISRFIENSRRKKHEREVGELKAHELINAEKAIVRLIQLESFSCEDIKRLKSINVFKDEAGILRVKTRLTERQDDSNFIFPMLLPKKHAIVEKIILHKHLANFHAGIHVLISKLRETFWILKSRSAIREALKRCVRCRRHEAKRLQTVPSTLPKDRVRDANVFEVVGVDLAGPLILKNKNKAWIILFTCAVFRAVHLELSLALSTEGFLLALRRFIARRGRPSIIYSDNGTNFVGSNNLLKTIDWKIIERETAINKMEWKFNPPAAPWWGGFWERLVQMIKKLLRRILGQSSLNYEELTSVLCDCEATVNSRPLTYVTEDSDDLIPLTPSMFLSEIPVYGVPDLDHIDKTDLNKRLRHIQGLRVTLRERFRSEYLSLLTQRSSSLPFAEQIKIGDIVLVECDNKRKVMWPLAKVTEVYPGKDGDIRVVRVKTASGELVRPIKRLFPLEITSMEPDGKAVTKTTTSESLVPDVSSSNSVPQLSKNIKTVVTRRGRKIKLPSRFFT